MSASPIRSEYYFVGADVPDTYPVSTESDKEPSDTCQKVADWARNSGAAPVNNDVDVRIQGPSGADITVLDVLARIEDQRSVAGPVRVRWPELVHDQVEPDYQVDFAQSGAALVRPPRREKRTSIIGDTSSADSSTQPLRTVIEWDRAGDPLFRMVATQAGMGTVGGQLDVLVARERNDRE